MDNCSHLGGYEFREWRIAVNLEKTSSLREQGDTHKGERENVTSDCQLVITAVTTSHHYQLPGSVLYNYVYKAY